MQAYTSYSLLRLSLCVTFSAPTVICPLRRESTKMQVKDLLFQRVYYKSKGAVELLAQLCGRRASSHRKHCRALGLDRASEGTWLCLAWETFASLGYQLCSVCSQSANSAGGLCYVDYNRRRMRSLRYYVYRLF